MAVLPEVVAAVDGKSAVIVDGAICRGTDIVKAIALGADAVGIGRMQGYGLAAAGKDGLIRILELLEEEMTICLGLLGVPRLGDLDASCIEAAEAVNDPHISSAFPLLDLHRHQYYTP
jgi:glycolate oxidase